MTRREEFSLLGNLVGIPKIHEPIFADKPPELEALKDINGGLDQDFLEFTNQYSGSNYGIEAFQQIINHVSIFYNLYLRAISNNDKYLRSFNFRQLDGDYEEREFQPHPRVNATIPDDSDERGRFPALGRWQVSGENTVYHHREFGNRFRNDVDLKDYFKEWREFLLGHSRECTMTTEESRTFLREKGFGELQAWLFWKYFTGRNLNCNSWSVDMPSCHSFYSQRDGESREDYGVRVWEHCGGIYDARIEQINLSTPEKGLPCAFPLGCVQNLGHDNAPFSNRLSWEHEHSRPRRWGGTDNSDTQVMCTHHNRLKGDGFIFDVKTFSKIIMIHRADLLLQEVQEQ